MATSGQLNTGTAYDSYFWVKWEQDGDQDIANNRTKIKWSCGVYCGHDFQSNAIKMSAVTICGTRVYGGGTYSYFKEGNHTIAEGTLWIPHDSDGSKSFKIAAFTGWLYSNHNYSANEASYSLTKIPRGATITAAPDFTDLDNPTISYSNPAGEAATTLMACISFSNTVDVEYRDIGKTEGTYTFEFSDDERKTLREGTSGSSRKLFFYVRTTFGPTTLYDKKEVTFSIVENADSKPEITMAVSLDNGSLPTKFDGLCIQGKSRFDVTLSAKGKYGANITGLRATLDGKTYHQETFKTDVIQAPGDTELVGYAQDTRGFSDSVCEPINVIPYSKPLVVPISDENAIRCYRSDGNGVRVGNSTSVWIKAKRTFYPVSGKNTCALQWRSKLTTEQWNDEAHLWSDLIANTATSTDQYDSLLAGKTFKLTQSYTVQVRVIDDVGETDIKTFEIPTRDVALHLGRGGKNVTIGTYCDYSEERTFHCVWKAIFDSDVIINGMTLADYIKSVINEGG